MRPTGWVVAARNCAVRAHALSGWAWLFAIAGLVGCPSPGDSGAALPLPTGLGTQAGETVVSASQVEVGSRTVGLALVRRDLEFQATDVAKWTRLSVIPPRNPRGALDCVSFYLVVWDPGDPAKPTIAWIKNSGIGEHDLAGIRYCAAAIFITKSQQAFVAVVESSRDAAVTDLWQVDLNASVATYPIEFDIEKWSQWPASPPLLYRHVSRVPEGTGLIVKDVQASDASGRVVLTIHGSDGASQARDPIVISFDPVTKEWQESPAKDGK